MVYKYILIVVDLFLESKVLVEKVVFMVCLYNVKVFLIYVDVNYFDFYIGLIDVNFGDM